MEILIAIHHHRHGEDVTVYDVTDFKSFGEDDVIEMLGEHFEADRDDEYLTLVGPYSKLDIKKVTAPDGRE